MDRIGAGRSGWWAFTTRVSASVDAAPAMTIERDACEDAVPAPCPPCSAGWPTVCMVKIPKSSAANSSSCPYLVLLVPNMAATLPLPGI